jgi:ribose transport system permease protein
MSAGKSFPRKILRAEFLLFYILVIMVVFFGIVCGESYMNMYNLTNILKSAGPLAIMVLGATWVVGSGQTDVAFPEIASCTSAVYAVLFASGVSSSIAGFAGIGVGVAAGLVSSFLVTKGGFHPLISTIAVSTGCGALAAAASGGQAVRLSAIVSGTAVYKLSKIQFGAIPMVFILALLITAILWAIQEKTKFGQYIFAMAENTQALNEAGVKTWLVKTILFLLSGLLASVAGLIYTITVYASGQPIMGTSFFIDGFTVIFLGALAFKLGKNNVCGTLIAAIILACLTYGLTQMGATFAMSQIVKGVLLLVGVGVVTVTNRRKLGKVGLMKYE